MRRRRGMSVKSVRLWESLVRLSVEERERERERERRGGRGERSIAARSAEAILISG